MAVKVSVLIEWLQTLEQDWEITYDDGSDMGEEINHIRVNEVKQQYTIE